MGGPPDTCCLGTRLERGRAAVCRVVADSAVGHCPLRITFDRRAAGAAVASRWDGWAPFPRSGRGHMTPASAGTPLPEEEDADVRARRASHHGRAALRALH